jgi:hypothetical protein
MRNVISDDKAEGLASTAERGGEGFVESIRAYRPSEEYPPEKIARARPPNDA